MPRAEQQLQQQPLSAAPRRRRPDSYRFPRWWFVVMALPNILPGLVGTAFGSIVWPLAVAKLAGFQDKALVFALCAQVGVVMSWSAPFIGVASDRTPPWIATRFGRRRPFILAGGLCFWFGNLVNYIAIRGLSSPSPVLLGVGLVTMNLGGCISGPAFNAIVPETVPLAQRGLSITVQTWLVYICALLGNGVGWMLGEQTFPWLTDDVIWRANVAMVGVQVPLQLIACNGTHGWWQPEHTTAAEPKSSPPPAGKSGFNSCVHTLQCC
jgi:MFS family permease